MIKGLKQMACGGCGNGSFEVYRKDHGDGGSIGEFMLFVECRKCKAVSVLEPSRPKILIQWAENNEKGVLCPMNPRETV